MKFIYLILISAVAILCFSTGATQLAITNVSTAGSLVLFDGVKTAPIIVKTNANVAVMREAGIWRRISVVGKHTFKIRAVDPGRGLKPYRYPNLHQNIVHLNKI